MREACRWWPTPSAWRSTGRRSSRCCSWSAATWPAPCASPTLRCELQDLAAGQGVDRTSTCRRSPPGSASTPATGCSPSTTTAASCPPLRAGVRRDRGRAHLGRHGPRSGRPGRDRPGDPLGRVDHLHQLRQVRAGVAHDSQGAVREGPRGRRGAGAPPLPALPPPAPARRPGRRGRAHHDRQAEPRDRLAGRLLRLPHVPAGPGRAAAGAARRPGRAGLRATRWSTARTTPTRSTCAWSRARSAPPTSATSAKVRALRKVLVALGDCAVTTNVPGMRNPIDWPLLARAYTENVATPAARPVPGGGSPRNGLPELLPDPPGPPGRPRGRVHARLPAVGRPHPPRPRQPAGRPAGPSEHARFGGTTQSRPWPARSRSTRSPRIEGHARITIHPRRARRGLRHPPARRSSAGSSGSARAARSTNALAHGPHLRHLPGQPPGRLGQGRRRHPRGHPAAGRQSTCLG